MCIIIVLYKTNPKFLGSLLLHMESYLQNSTPLEKKQSTLHNELQSLWKNFKSKSCLNACIKHL